MTNIDQNTPLSSSFNSSLPAGMSALPQWGLILVQGPDAASFLQNQLTNSVLGLSSNPSLVATPSNSSTRLIGYCSPKGRLIASAWITLASVDEQADDCFALFISRDIAASIAKRLSMYVLRSKVRVSDVSNDWTISGLFAAKNDLDSLNLSERRIGIRIPDVQVNSQSFARALIAEPNNIKIRDIDEKSLDIWNDLEVLSGIPRIVLATQEQFVPQMINFESVGGVDFKKGCYPGQEIVARSQYRGVIKRRLSLAHTSSANVDPNFLHPGTEIFHSGDPSQPAGMVVLSSHSCFIGNQIDLQIECKLEALESGEIRLGNPAGPVLKIDPLPYKLLEI